MAKRKSGGRKKTSKKKAKKRGKKKASKRKTKKRGKKKATKRKTKKKVSKKRGKKKAKKRGKKKAKKRAKKKAKRKTKKVSAKGHDWTRGSCHFRAARSGSKWKLTAWTKAHPGHALIGHYDTLSAAKRAAARWKPPAKRKAAKKVARRAKPARAVRRRPRLPAGVPKVKFTVPQAEAKLDAAGKKLAKSAKKSKRARKKTPGLSTAARRMQLASQGLLQVNTGGDNPVQAVPGHRGLYVVTPPKGAKVRSKAVAVRTGKRSKTKAGRGTVSKRPVSKKREEELNRIRRAAGIPVRRK